MTAPGLRRIGILPDLAARPLFTRFREPEYDVVRDVPGVLGIRLRERKLDGAFLSPVDAARSPRGLRPAGGGSLVARAGSNTARLLFHEGIRSIRTLSADPGRISEIVLAHIVLVEQYGIVPSIVPRRGTPEEALLDCDAVLLAGDEAAGVRAVEEGLDLVEEWFDIADMPFVHGLWYVRDDAEGGGEGDADAAADGFFACDAPGTASLGYRFDEEARAGLAEFIRMAYYHGIINDIPDFPEFLPEPSV